MKAFKKHLAALNSQLPSGLLSDLFRDIDSSTKGSIYFSELTNYYLAHSADTDIMYYSFHSAFGSSASIFMRTTWTPKSFGSCLGSRLRLKSPKLSSWKLWERLSRQRAKRPGRGCGGALTREEVLAHLPASFAPSVNTS